jgi:hypothetical protein
MDDIGRFGGRPLEMLLDAGVKREANRCHAEIKGERVGVP